MEEVRANLAGKWSSFRKQITLEPMIAMVFFAHQIVGGGGITTDLMFLKVCSQEFEFDDSICANLTKKENEYYQIMVQKRVNSFEITRDWIGNFPPMFFGLIAGALSDQFGRKPLMLVPLMGMVLTSVVPLVFWYYMDLLPLEFMILEEMHNYVGGLAVYFVGSYSYGSSVTTPSTRSMVLSRYDGVESLAMIAGAALSTVVFKYFGFAGNYGLRMAFYAAAAAYLAFVVEEPIKDRKNVGDLLSWSKLPRHFHDYFVKSVVDTAKTYFRPRPNNLRWVLLAQITLYGCYKFSNANFPLIYPYMKLEFEAENSDFALLKSVLKALQATALLIMVPLMSKMLGMHDTLIVAICSFTNASALFASAMVSDLWPFIICRWGTMLRMCQYGAGRSLVTRTVDHDEMGKALSGYAIVSSLVPYFAMPAMRYIYQSTMETFSSLNIVVESAFVMVACLLNFWLFAFNRKKFRNEEESGKEETEEVDEEKA